jgi:hypothetical protein
MKYQFSIQNDRVKYLTKELSDKITIISQDDEWTRLEITIESSLEILLVFHAGCRAGVDAMMPSNMKD